MQYGEAAVQYGEAAVQYGETAVQYGEAAVRDLPGSRAQHSNKLVEIQGSSVVPVSTTSDSAPRPAYS